MALADIIAGILEDAEKEASQLIAAAKEEAEKISQNSEGTLAATVADIQAKGEEKAAQVHKKVENLASHERKSQVLAAKHDVLSQVFADAKKKIIALPSAEKEKIYAEIISDIDAGSGTLHPAAGEKKSVEVALKQSGKPFDVADEEEETGGFRFTSENMDMDFRFTALVDRELSGNLKRELSLLLFGE